MSKPFVALAVLVPVAAVLGVVLQRTSTSSPVSWSRSEMRLATAAALLVVPAAVALGVVHGTAQGVGAFLLWGVLAGVFLGAARLDREGLEGDTRWLLDVSCLAFVGLTVFFSVVDFGYPFIPAACCLVVGLRFARMRRRRHAARDLRHPV